MTHYRALILDMDETLLKKDKTISTPTKQAIIQLQQQGISVILASGRATYGMLLEANALQLDKFNSHIIAYNGAEIINVASKHIVYQQSLTLDDIITIQQFARQQHVGIIAPQQQHIYIEGYNSHADAEFTVNNMTVVKTDNILSHITSNIPKLILFDCTERMIDIFHTAQQYFGDLYSITRSNQNYVEFMPKNVSKGTAIEHLSQIINIPTEQMIACGDSFNDIQMLQTVGMGIAMDNAIPELKAIAKDVTLSHEEDGIVHVIDKYFK